ncbi:MAG: class II aldolase/adducin family protein [Clostridia bacterium]|nr:class II aldolase/adducin family protein [Clostridia bacterium]
MNIKNLSTKEQVLEAMNRVYSNALTTTSGGNISAIDEQGHIFITPSGIDKGTLTIDDIVEVLPDGTCIGKHAPSMELPFHSNIYRECKDIKAIVHAHAPAAVAYACMRVAPDSSCARVYEDKLGKIAGSRYALPGSLKLGEIVMQGFKDGYRTVMMDNHGATVGGADMQKALAMYETLDYLCRSLFQAQILGGAKYIDKKINLKSSVYPVKKIDGGDIAKREELTAFIKRAYKGQLVGSGWGTLAIRDKNGVLFNADCDSPLDLSKEDIVRYENGAVSADKPCKYLDLILKIFEKTPEAQSIFVSMPAAVMGFAMANVEFDARLIPESYIMLKDVKRLPYSAIGNYDFIADALTTVCPVTVIDNECIITIGKNTLKAFDRLEVCDYSARSVLLAKSVAKINPIDGTQVKEIDDNFNGW